MSSVSSSQYDVNRRNRDDYNNKEAQLEKKYLQEISRLNKAHAKEVRQLKASYEAEIKDLQSRTRTDLSEKDRDYQNEISKMRDAQMNQMRKVAEENEAKRDQVREAARQQLQDQKNITQVQEDNLRTNFQNELAERDHEFQDYVNKTRDTGKRAYEHQQQQLNAAHQKEMNAEREGHTEQVMQMQHDYNAMAKSKDAELKDLNRNFNNQKDRMELNFMDNVKDEREARNRAIELQRQGFKDDLSQIRDKYAKLYQKNQNDIHSSQEQFKDSVNDRLNNETFALKKRIQELKQAEVGKETSLKQQYEADRRNLRDEYMKATDQFHERAKDAVQEEVDRRHHQLDDVAKQDSKILSDTNRYYRDQIDQNHMRHDEQVQGMETQYANEKAHNQKYNDRRVQNLLSESERERNEILKMAKDEIDQTRQDKLDKLKEQRQASIQAQNQLSHRMADEIRKQEGEYSEKIDDLTAKYEAQITQMRNQHADEMRHLQKETDQRLADQQKAVNMQLQTQDIQNQRKLRLMEERHEQELKEVSRRYQTQIDSMAQHLKQS